MNLQKYNVKTYGKIFLTVILVGIFCGFPIWFFLTRWQILPLINPLGFFARFEWDRTHGVKTFNLTRLPAGVQMGASWEYMVALQIKPKLDDYLRKGPWLTASGHAELKVAEYVPVALPEGWGLGGLEIDDPNFTALMRAVIEVDLGSVKKLLAEGAEVNAKDQWGRTALMYACSKGRTSQEFVDILLAAGADPNAVDHEGRTALYSAAIVKGIEVIEALLRAGADPNLANQSGGGPLIAAAYGGDTNKVQALLRAGADPNHADQWGHTALMAASHGGYAATVRLLLAARANVNAKDKDGKTALSLAEQVGFIDVMKLLRGAGATL